MFDVGVLREVLGHVDDEVHRAHRKHGAQSMIHAALPDAERLPILVEELGEVGRGLTYDGDEGTHHLYTELVQLAAMAVSWACVLKERGLS